MDGLAWGDENSEEGRTSCAVITEGAGMSWSSLQRVALGTGAGPERLVAWALREEEV